MIANGAHHGNGVQIIPNYPADTQGPKWRDAFPRFTHNLSWQDADGCSHSMTLRADDLQDLLGDLKLIKADIRQAKAKRVEPKAKSQETPGAVPCASAMSQPSHEQVPPANVPDVLPCRIHGVSMERRWSKRTGGSYFSHRLSDGSLCYGKPK